MKRFLIFCGLAVFAGLYYLAASQNIYQPLKAFPSSQYPDLHNFFISITKPLVLSTISILAYFAGLVLRRNKAELWAERLILICALVAGLPFVLSFFIGSYTDASSDFSKEFSSLLKPDDPAKTAEMSQSNFAALVTRAKAGDMASILTLAHLYCVDCDSSVKLDLRDPALLSTNTDPEDLSEYRKPDEDIKAAFDLYETAARLGNLRAKNVLGEMLVHGVGVLQDLGKALQLFTDAARQGYVPAQFNLAAMYEYGYGVPKDNLHAHMWYNIIAAEAKDHANDDALYARSLRDALESSMTTGAIAQANEKAALCMASGLQNCR